MRIQGMEFKDLLKEIEAVYNDDPAPLDEAINTALSEARKSAIRTNKKSEVTIKIKMNPKGETMFLSADITAKIPKQIPVDTRLFVDNRGELHAEDPRQGTISNFIDEREAANA